MYSDRNSCENLQLSARRIDNVKSYFLGVFFERIFGDDLLLPFPKNYC